MLPFAIVKRRAIKLFMFLLAGAIINVAVAWGRALWNREAPVVMHQHQIDHGFMREAFGDSIDFFEIPGAWSTITGVGVRRVWAVAIGARDSEGQDVYGRAIVQSGWPLHALHGERLSKGDAVWARWGTWPPEAWTKRIGAVDATPLPLRPMWPGFAINTVFYAALLWLLYSTPLELRRRRRAKRGQCELCGYSLRGRANLSECCPECGTAVTTPSTAW